MVAEFRTVDTADGSEDVTTRADSNTAVFVVAFDQVGAEDETSSDDALFLVGIFPWVRYSWHCKDFGVYLRYVRGLDMYVEWRRLEVEYGS